MPRHDFRVSFTDRGFPYVDAPVFRTPRGTPYLKTPGVALIARPEVDLQGFQAAFLDGFDADLGFGTYTADPTPLPPCEQLVKASGQLCYMSMGAKRRHNKDAQAYVDHLRQSGHGCYDGDTEVLTLDGWKRWAEVTKADQLATRSAAGDVEYAHPTNLIAADYSGRMYRVKSEGVDLLVTPNHNMLVCPTTTKAGRRKETYQLLRADELGDTAHAYVKSGNWVPKSPRVLAWTPEVMALLGFTVGDGHVTGKRARFHLRKPRKIAWLAAMTTRAGWEFWGEGDRFEVVIPDNFVDLFRQVYTADGEKQIPAGVLRLGYRDQLDGLYDGLIESDGHRGRTGVSFDTTSDRLAGQFQHLCLHIGLAANVTYVIDATQRAERGSFGTKPLTRLTVITRKLRPEVNKFAGAEGRTHWVEGWSGKVYCAEVPNHTLYVRRQGKPVWCGNSVLEHPNMTFHVWGIDRSVTHELVRHRAGMAFSQISQRFVDGTLLRFVERPEWQPDVVRALMAEFPGTGPGTPAMTAELEALLAEAHEQFEADIDAASAAYDDRADVLRRLRELGHPMLQGGDPTEVRKRANQVARDRLGNCVEAPIVITANVRALRHVIEMRANSAADVLIRGMAVRMLACAVEVAPLLFADYEVERLPAGGSGVKTPTRKV